MNKRYQLDGDEFDSHHDLEAVEELGLGTLYLGTESLHQVFVHDTIRLQHIKSRQLDCNKHWQAPNRTHSSKERQNVLDKVTLILVHLVLPVVQVHRKVDFFGSPKR